MFFRLEFTADQNTVNPRYSKECTPLTFNISKVKAILMMKGTDKGIQFSHAPKREHGLVVVI